MMENNPKIQTMSLSGLASAYSVSYHTMRNWLIKGELLKKTGEGYLYTPKEVKAIFEHLGNP